MTKKLRFSLTIIYCVAILLLFSPFLKQVLLIFQTQDISVEQKVPIETFGNASIEAVQPPGLVDVLTFNKNKNFEAVGKIVIPEVEIGLPVFQGVTSRYLLVGAGTLFPERVVKNHNLVLIAHHLGRDNLLFGKLLKLTRGNSIYLEYQNEFYHYIITQTKVIKQTEFQVLDDQNKSEITLVTCDKPTQTSNRFIAKGKLERMPSQKLKKEILQQEQLILKRNHEKDLNYCILTISILLLFLLIGVRRIVITQPN